MIRRCPEAIVQAAAMDQERKDLFVEGIRDKLALEFLASADRNPDVRIFVIDETADIDQSVCGAKGRLLHLARTAADAGVTNLRFLVDREFDHLTGTSYPPNTWHTALPDFDSHLFAPYYVRKAIHLGYLKESVSPEDLLAHVFSICRTLSCLRLLSLREGLDLPINDSRKSKFLTLRKGELCFDFDKYLRAVMQSAGMPLRGHGTLAVKHAQLTTELSELADRQLVRARDFFEICEIVLRRFGVDTKELPSVFWAAVDERSIESDDDLTAAIRFLSRGNRTKASSVRGKQRR